MESQANARSVIQFDFKNPDYASVFAERIDRLRWIRADPDERVPGLKRYYHDNPADFINDWGCTFDPRNLDSDLPSFIPFVLMPRQREWINYTLRKWREGRPALTDKSRDAGVSWLAVSLGCTLCLFYDGMVIGYGSRKEEYVDKLDSPKSLFYKARKFMEYVPPEFNGGWNPRRDAPYMRLLFRSTNSAMTGEAGDGIGRGDRTSLYFVDESAHLERPQLVDASLSATTRARHDISSANGMANPFAVKRFGGKIETFTFSWRDDLRKDEEWYARQLEDLDPVTVAQEIDIDYSASVEGVVIPSMWVQACINARQKLGLSISGGKYAALDVADEGIDVNAIAAGQGFELSYLEESSGRGSDIFATTQWAFGVCDNLGLDGFIFDSDGLGASVRGDARVINEQRQRRLIVDPFRGSAAVYSPEREDVKGRKNEDYFSNRKAQAWWALRLRCMRTYRWVVQGRPCAPDEILSIDADAIPAGVLGKLTAELSQPTYILNTAGKIVIDKAPEGFKSPNLADAVMIRFSGQRRSGMVISAAALARARGRR